MDYLNIRVYKIVLPDGTSAFEMKSEDGRGSVGCNSIESLVLAVQDITKLFFLKNQSRLSRVTVDTKPYHEIECPSGLTPRRCLRLSKSEKDEFWNEFNKS